MSDKFTISEVTTKLIGCIGPYGESRTDEQRLKNLEKHIEVIQDLIEPLIETAIFKERYEHSMKVMGIKAEKAIIELHDRLSECFNEDSE